MYIISIINAETRLMNSTNMPAIFESLYTYIPEFENLNRNS